MKIDELIEQRGKVHGDFSDNSATSQTFKSYARTMPNWRNNRLSFEQRECIDMILLKIGRIGSGDPNFKDHWDDIAGYAMLAVQIISTRGE